MPTIVLLDTSLSMRRPASRAKAEEETRHSLSCRGLQWFFDYLNSFFPYEYTALSTFSSNCETIAGFTRDYGSLKEKLADIPFQDRTDLHSALITAIDIVVAEWGTFAPCQIVVVTDGSPGVRHQDSYLHHKQVMCVPFSCKLNVVCIATHDELLASSSSSSQSCLQRLCETADITPSEVFFPTGTLNTESVKGAFKQLAKACFQPYMGTLKCGHLNTRISLTPSPAMQTAKFNIVINAEHKFRRVDENLGSLQFPSEMLICGFLDNSCIPAPPHYSRHFVLDPVTVEQESDLLSPTEKRPATSNSEEALKPSFRVLLHGSLKCESKSALLKLGERWYGLLFSQTSNSKKANLVLCVLYPNMELPWLGQLAYLGPKSSDVTDPRIQAPTNSEISPFPVVPSHLPSFHSPSSLLWAKEAVLQTDISKVIRYSRKLPEKEFALVKELNKLRLVALTYCMPELLKVICEILSREEKMSNTNPQICNLLKNCIDFLDKNKNPQDQLVIKKNY